MGLITCSAVVSLFVLFVLFALFVCLFCSYNMCPVIQLGVCLNADCVVLIMLG